MVELFKTLIPQFSHFQEGELINSVNKSVGFQSSIITKSGTPYAGGTAGDLNLARRICVAEAIERASFINVSIKKKVDDLYLLEEYPTTCGFAAGFNVNHTIFRSICEAVERWAWSKWIDDELGIPEVEVNLSSELSQFYSDAFDRVHFFQREIKLSDKLLPSFIGSDFHLSIAIGVKGKGIFPGSRVTTLEDEPWEHSLLEAWRHKIILENEILQSEPETLFDRRIKHFGEDGLDTLSKIRSFSIGEFPRPQLRLLKEVARGKYDISNLYYVWRALCSDYVGWDKGDDTRFVY